MNMTLMIVSNIAVLPFDTDAPVSDTEQLYDSVNNPQPGCSWWEPHQYPTIKPAKKPTNPVNKVCGSFLLFSTWGKLRC